MRALATLLAFLATAGVVTPAYAQMVDGPPGSTGGLFGGRRPVSPNRNSHALDLSIDLSGGYDQDPNAFPADLSFAGGSDRGWTVGQGMVSTSYRVGQTRRSLDARARGNVNYQGNTRTPLMGGGATLSGFVKLGRQHLNQILVSLEASYDPGSIFGVVNPALPQEDAIERLDIVPTLGVIEQRWFSTSATSGYQHHWSARHQSDILVGAGRVKPSGDTGSDSQWLNALFTQAWTINSAFDFTGSYRFDHSLQESPARLDVTPLPSTPAKYQTGTFGVRYSRRLSSVRRMSLSVAGGATQVLSDTGATLTDAVHPTASVNLEITPARAWSVSLIGNRSVAVLSGISSQPITSDTVALGLQGTIARRLRLAVNGSYMKGSSLVGETASFTTGVGGNVSVRYGFRNWVGTFATYSYYHHTLESGLQVAALLPPLYDRHTVRGGITLWLPLYGTF